MLIAWRIREKKNTLSNQLLSMSWKFGNEKLLFQIFSVHTQSNNYCWRHNQVSSKFSSLTKNSESKISKIWNLNAFFEEIYLWLCTLTPLISRLIKCLILCQLVKVATKLAKRRPFFYLIFSTLPWSLQKLWTQTKICSQHAYIKSERNT